MKRCHTLLSIKGLSWHVCCGEQNSCFSRSNGAGRDKALLAKLEYDWIMAEFRLDMAMLSSILDQSFISIDSAGILNRQQELKSVYETVMQMRKSDHVVDSLRLDELHFQIYGTTAVVTFVAVTGGIRHRIPFQNRCTRFYDVWIKRNGNWKTVSSQVTMLHTNGGAKLYCDCSK